MNAAIDPRDADSGSAPALARCVAFLVDATLVFAIVLGARLAAMHGLLPPLGAWRPGASGWFDPLSLGLAFAWLALRDVPFGTSFGKWLLCLKVVGPDGRPLPRSRRLQRALLQFFPFTSWRHDRRTTPRWSVVAYAPAGLGLALRAALAVTATAWSLASGFETLRPSISKSDAERLASETVVVDPGLRNQLGEPLHFEVRDIVPRSRLALDKQAGEFALRVRGAHLRQDMVVRAVKVDGRWAVEEIVDIRVAALDAAPGDTVAVR